MTAVVPPIQLCCFRRIQAYPILSYPIKSSLGNLALFISLQQDSGE